MERKDEKKGRVIEFLRNKKKGQKKDPPEIICPDKTKEKPKSEKPSPAKEKSIPETQETAKKKTKSTTNPVEVNPEEKVGILARTLLREALEDGKANDKEINLMQTKEYSSITFGLDFPLLTLEKKERYYAKPLIIKGVEYWMCSEWYIGDKPLLLEWLRDKGVNI